MPRVAVTVGLVLAISASLGASGAEARTARQTADRAALAMLKPAREAGVDGAVTLFAAGKPLPAGTVLGAEGQGGGVRLRRPAYLYWEDLAHGFRFPHPSYLLLLDRHGRRVAKQGMATYPLVSGRPPAFLRSPAAYFGARGALYVRHRLDARGAPRSFPAQAAQELPAVGLITVGPRTEPTFTGDFAVIEKAGSDLHIKTSQATTVDTLKQAITDQIAAGKYDLMIYVGGHGLPVNGSYSKGKIKIPTSPRPQVEINGTVVNGRPVQGGVLFAEDFATMLAGFKNAHFTVVVDSCFGGRFLAPLAGLSNVSVVATATNANHFVRNGFGQAIADGLRAFASSPGHLGDLEFPEAMQSAQMKEAIDKFQKRSPKENFPQLVPHGAPAPPPPEPGLTPIHAVFTPAANGARCAPPACTTVYSETAFGTDLTYRWAVAIPADTMCANGFQPGVPSADEASWYHADAAEGGPCNHAGGTYDMAGAGHPGTVVVQVSDANYTCVATYYGTQGPAGQPQGDGPDPQPCQHK